MLLYSDLPADEAEYLRAHQREESYWLDRYFGLQAETRSEGIAVIDPDGYLTDLSFPAGSTVARMALLALEPLTGTSARTAQGGAWSRGTRFGMSALTCASATRRHGRKPRDPT